MNRLLTTAAFCMVFILFFCADYCHAIETEVRGRIQSTYVLRDTDGFQHGVMDQAEGVQWRNEIKLDFTYKPEYEKFHQLRVEKVFMTLRVAYDAIFDVRTDEYADVREKSPADFELGEDDLKIETDLREAFFDVVAEGYDQSAVLRIGRQIVQWGESDGFNVMNVINPQDNSVLMFFETPEDLATPLWMARLNYSKPNIGWVKDIGIELVATPDIRPHQFSVLDDNMNAPYAFGFKQLKDKDFEYFHKLSVDLGFTAMGADLGTINDLEAMLQGFGIDNPTAFKSDVPTSGMNHLEYGGKFSSTFGDLATSLYYFHGYQDDGAIDFTDLIYRQKLTFRHPSQDIFGASFNYFIAPINTVIRGEGNLTSEVAMLDLTGVNGNAGALLADWGVPDPLPPSGTRGYVKEKVYQGLIGADHDRWIRWLNPSMMIHTSWQAYWKHIRHWDYDSMYRPFDKKDNYRFTGYIWTQYWHGRIHPELFFMYDTEDVLMTMTSVTYTRDGMWFAKLTQMSFWGDSDAISPFTQPVNLINTSEVSFRIGYQW